MGDCYSDGGARCQRRGWVENSSIVRAGVQPNRLMVRHFLSIKSSFWVESHHFE